MEPQKPVEWLKLPELAQKWRVSVRTIERLVSAKTARLLHQPGRRGVEP